MGLIEQVRLDVQSIRGNPNDFGQLLTLIAPTSPETVINIYGTARKNHTQMDEFGLKVRSKGNTIYASCTVSMLTLNENNYPYRDSEEKTTFKGHRVNWTDISGEYNYEVNEWEPNENAGEVVLKLGFYGTD